MRIRLRGRFWLALLSLLISLCVWGIVQPDQPGSTTPSMPISVDLQPENLDTVHYHVLDPLGKVTIIVSGPQKQLAGVDPSRVHAYVDLAGVNEGQNDCPIHLDTADYKLDFKLTRNQIRVAIEPVVTEVEPVVVETRGESNVQGQICTTATVLPTTVQLTGPKSKVDSVAKVRALLDLGAIKPGVIVNEHVDLLGPQDEPIAGVVASPQSVSLQPIFLPAPVERTVLINALFRGQPEFAYRVQPDGIKVSPPTMVVQGPSSDIATLPAILETDPIDISGIHATGSFQTVVRLPHGLHTPDGETVIQVRVTVPVEGPSVNAGG